MSSPNASRAWRSRSVPHRAIRARDYFGGKYYTDKELIPAFEPFAKKLAADAEGILDADEEFTEKAGKFDKINLAEYLAKTGKGVDKWVVDMLRVAYTIEYGRDLEEQSSLNLITYLSADTSQGLKLFRRQRRVETDQRRKQLSA